MFTLQETSKNNASDFNRLFAKREPVKSPEMFEADLLKPTSKLGYKGKTDDSGEVIFQQYPCL